jgi:hypothetical protein
LTIPSAIPPFPPFDHSVRHRAIPAIPSIRPFSLPFHRSAILLFCHLSFCHSATNITTP